MCNYLLILCQDLLHGHHGHINTSTLPAVWFYLILAVTWGQNDSWSKKIVSPPSFSFYRESRWLIWVFSCRYLAWGGMKHPSLLCKLKVPAIMTDSCKQMAPKLKLSPEYFGCLVGFCFHVNKTVLLPGCTTCI